MARVLCVGDMHHPFCHPGYLDFCRDLYRQWKCDRVVFIGDAVDNHAISAHWQADPSGMSPGEELAEAIVCLKRWRKAFPQAMVCIGNHDRRPYLNVREMKLPNEVIKSYGELYGTGCWDWQIQHQIDGVMYTHGTGNSGKHAALRLAERNRQSTVMGHTHTYGGVQFSATWHNLIFGLNVGCGIDVDAYAAAYAKELPVKPTLGAGIVLDGQYAYFEPMPLGRKETNVN